jgi:catechol 2,3-dioxygenase-like lactoylglutathione lyase family enzyme
MFDHVTIRVSDREASERFYETVLSTLGIEKTYSDGYLAEWDDFSLSPAEAEKPATRRLHIGFVAPSRAHVGAFWRVGTEAGFRDDGAPGLRPEYGGDYYGGFLLDPDGNSAEAVHHGRLRQDGVIDHVWVRVAEVTAAKRFYETVAPRAGFRLDHDSPDRAQFTSGNGSFSVVVGTPSEHVHMAFPVADNATVDEFHRAAIAAGYRDNGPPGERPVYHPGYYGAFVLDPDASGFELCGRLRDGEPGRRWNRDVPVIMVSARGDPVDRVRGFARGCDDYVVRPFVYDELLARMRAVLRRSNGPRHPRLTVRDLEIDLASRVVTLAGETVQLSAKEYELLVALAEDPERVFRKEELLRNVWGFRSLGRTHRSYPTRRPHTVSPRLLIGAGEALPTGGSAQTTEGCFHGERWSRSCA